jgi:hypothetical protein
VDGNVLKFRHTKLIIITTKTTNIIGFEEYSKKYKGVTIIINIDIEKGINNFIVVSTSKKILKGL